MFSVSGTFWNTQGSSFMAGNRYLWSGRVAGGCDRTLTCFPFGVFP